MGSGAMRARAALSVSRPGTKVPTDARNGADGRVGAGSELCSVASHLF